jgi:glycogen(starch) synthase
MKVLMLGWEFPPFITGGLGTACYGLTKAMANLGIGVFFVLPRPVDTSLSSHVTLITPPGEPPPPKEPADSGRIAILSLESALSPYARPEDVEGTLQTGRAFLDVLSGQASEAGGRVSVRWQPKPGQVTGDPYAGDLFDWIQRYAEMVCRLTPGYDFDVIHAHDWMTYRAGIALANRTGKPLVVHVHSTEFDRSGEHVNQAIYDVEREGMHRADRVIAVSYLTRNIIVRRYALDPDKVTVVYNAIDANDRATPPSPSRIRRNEKIVLFLGRITMQKGPEYFIAAAKKVLQRMDDVRFIMAGSGDLARQMIEMAAREGIGRKVLFTGFLRGRDVERVYHLADLYVMPSVSEPFGLVALEALSYGVPVILSKQSGVAEVLTNVLKVDFWDVNEMANKIVSVLRHPPLHAALRRHGSFEVSKLCWKDAALKCLGLYEDLVRRQAEHP